MKTILTLLFLSFLSFSALAGIHAVDGETVTANGYVKAGCIQITFVFDSSFAGSISGAAFTYAGGDRSLTVGPLSSPSERFNDVYFKITAGSMRIIEVK